MIFNDKRVLVIGDSILDETILGKAVGLSLESPTLKINENSREITFGGAANVVKNILALGAKCTYMTPLAPDGYLQHYNNWSHDNFRLEHINGISSNTVKTRVWIEKSGERYKYLQINKSNKSEEVDNISISSLKYHMRYTDVVLLVDYGLGMFGDVNYIIDEARKHSIPVISSSQESSGKNRLLLFSDSDYLCVNERESQYIAKHRPGCVTLGNKGSVFTDQKVVYKTPGFKVDCIDPCGAGDSFLAALSLCISDITKESLRFCNAWAAMSTTKIGTILPTLEETYELLGSSGS
jgi:D-beta-D-heptose 7-phosphate kinase/D-beta-D-heptose 1-phosphate adenosyltransferase